MDITKIETTAHKMCIEYVGYDGLHHTREYTQSEIYCPNCGKKGVWLSDSNDYYLGTTGHCQYCLQCHHNAGDFYKCDEEVIKRLKQLSHE